MPVDPETQSLIASAQDKIRRGEEPTEEEMRELITVARAGRRAAADASARKRAKPVEITVSTLFSAKR